MVDELGESHPALRALPEGEQVRAFIPATTTTIVITDHRIAVTDEERLALDVEISAVRRIQFDIERERPATLVIVPEQPEHVPQVLAIPPEHFPAVGEALAFIGQQLYREP
jgi:hypothetical protein